MSLYCLTGFFETTHHVGTNLYVVTTNHVGTNLYVVTSKASESKPFPPTVSVLGIDHGSSRDKQT